MIKRFNESQNIDEVYCIIIGDGAGFPNEDYCASFDSYIKAADYYIKYVNKFYEKKFEPFFDSDGSRFFLNIKDNPDWNNCLKFVGDSESPIYVDIVVLKLNEKKSWQQ